MKEKIAQIFNNKIFIISSLIILALGLIAGVSFAWVGRTSEAELKATVAKILVESDYTQLNTEIELDNIMPGDEISGPIYVQLSEHSRDAYIRFKLSLEVDNSEGSFDLSSDQEKWLKEINFNICETSYDSEYKWSPYRGGYYYLLSNASGLGEGVEQMLRVKNLAETGGTNKIYELTQGVQIDFNSNMVFTDEHG